MSEPYIIINIDGVQRPLRYTSRSQYDFEKRHGKSLIGVLIDLTRADQAGKEKTMMSMVLLCDLLWAGLKWKDKTLTFDKVVDMIDDFLDKGGQVFELWPDILKAIEHSGIVQSLAKRAEEEAQDAPPGNAQTEPEIMSPVNSGSAIG